jgi:hypothetical protein
MSRVWSLSKKQVMFIVGYSLVFPLTNTVGGVLAEIGIFLTIPFLPIAWMFGVYFVSLTGSESTYLIGAFLAVLLQVWVVFVVRASVKIRKNG